MEREDDIDEKIIGRNGSNFKKISTIQEKSPTKVMSQKDKLKPSRKFSDNR